MKKLLASLLLTCALVASAHAQITTPNPTAIAGTGFPLSAQGAATLNSNDQINMGHGLYCVFNQSTHTGTPSTTFAIQAKDTVSGQYVTVLTSAAITADNTPASLTVYPGASATANVSSGGVLPRTYRIQVVVGGTTPAVTATVSCAVIP